MPPSFEGEYLPDRPTDETIRFMQTVKKPWIAFKIMAAGAIPPNWWAIAPMFRVIDPSRNKIAADPCESFTQMGETQMTAIDTACGWLPPILI